MINSEATHALMLHYNLRHGPPIIKWLKEVRGSRVTCLIVNLGEIDDPQGTEMILRTAGAQDVVHLDARDRFADAILSRAIKANAVYEGGYNLSAALARPLLAMAATECCRARGLDVVVHGFRGNDQVRMEMGFQSLGQSCIPALAHMDLDDAEVDAFAKAHGIPAQFGTLNPYSTSENLWGRSIECGPLEDPWLEPRPETWSLVRRPEAAAPDPVDVEIDFEAGIPIALDGDRLCLRAVIERLGLLASAHGVGRVDMLENGFVGLKTRAVYEAPAATCLLMAHADLEGFTSNCHEAAFKRTVDARWTEMVYCGRWFDPAMAHLDTYIDSQNRYVNGRVRLRLYRGSARVTGRSSPMAVYDPDRAIYQFGHGYAKADACAAATQANLPTMAARAARGSE